MTFYYAIPQMVVTDSRYVIAIADLLLRTGNLDMRPLVAADKGLPLPRSPFLVVRASDLAPKIVVAAKAAGIEPFGKIGTVDYYSTYVLFNNIPGDVTSSLVTAPPAVLPFFPTWPSFAAMPISLVTTALGAPVFDGATFHEDRNERYQKIVAAFLAATAVVFFMRRHGVFCRGRSL